MQSLYDSSNTEIIKIFLTKEERTALTSLMDLPTELSQIVNEHVVYLNDSSFNWDFVTADGYEIYKDTHYPITWLNSPSTIKQHLKKSLRHSVKLIIRTPKLKTRIPYDFPRVLISKSFGPEVD